MNMLYVVLGAAIGAPARFAIDQYIHRFSPKPYGIFLVNILGSFFLGLTFHSGENIYSLVAIGFTGAFTTWSTFMLDIFLAYELRRYKEAGFNMILSLGFGLLAAWCGLQLAQWSDLGFDLIWGMWQLVESELNNQSYWVGMVVELDYPREETAPIVTRCGIGRFPNIFRYIQSGKCRNP